ncbi:MAG TPA: alkaline phosphatase family protein [Streptosporangiaceae bacterium]|nr:alkaline phosphatase family protein [Streptosporangiaceae bacterium]
MPSIEHVIVLALENRSFDHMLGFLEHPDPAFDGLSRDAPHVNPVWRGRGTVAAAPDAKPVLPVDPDHSHDAVMAQLAVRGLGRSRQATNQGFVASYERKARGLAPPRFAGLLGPLLNWWTSRGPGAGDHPPVVDRGPLIMACQSPKQVPVLSTLALEFAVCVRWFCSVPGETWPNRNFMHAATSDGETAIYLRLYKNRTIFELLEDHGKSWRIYHDDTPQAWAFPNLWDSPGRHANWFPLDTFAEHVAAGNLPAYSFIEPNHRPPLHTLDRAPGIGEPGVSNSQHPGNNLVADAAYDRFPEGVPQGEDTDFARGEALVATIYEALRANPAIFERSVLLITYDEHGGFYDHVPPPVGVPAPGDVPGRTTKLLRALYRRKSATFDFTMLGPRVPAVVVSPYIPARTVDAETHDHACVPATLRRIFAPDAEPLNARDRWAAAHPFDACLTLDRPRTDLPDLSEHVRGVRPAAPPAPATEVPGYYADFADQAVRVREHLEHIEETEVTTMKVAPAPPPGAPVTRRLADQTSRAFAEAADRHRQEGH